jgi:hypothetical protein
MEFTRYFNLKRDILRALPRILEKRVEIMKNRKANTNFLLNIITPAWNLDFVKIKLEKVLHG